MKGTWTTTGGDGGILPLMAVGVGAAVLIGSGALTAAVAAVTELLTIVLICAVALVVAVLVAGVLWWRHLHKYGRRPGEMPPQMREQIRAFHEFKAAEQLRASRQRPARQVEAPAAGTYQLHNHTH